MLNCFSVGLSTKRCVRFIAKAELLKGIGKDIDEYDDIAKNLELYENDSKWKKVIADSKRFVGVIESISESPCSMLLYDKPVRQELGLVRTSKDKFCCLLDGYNCDKYKYLKND